MSEPRGLVETHRPPTPRLLLLGLGNDILSDDAIGLRVTSELCQRLGHRADVSVCTTTEMGLSLLDHVAGFQELVIVDAVQTSRAPIGSVHEIDANDLSVLPTVSPHFLGLAETLALGRQLGLPMPRHTRILAIEVQDPFTVGERLTPELERSLPSLLNKVEAVVMETLSTSRTVAS